MLLGFIEEIEVEETGPNLNVTIRHLDGGQTFEVHVRVRRIEFHQIPRTERAEGSKTRIRVHQANLAAIVTGATLHVCPRNRVREFLPLDLSVP